MVDVVTVWVVSLWGALDWRGSAVLSVGDAGAVDIVGSVIRDERA